METAASCEMPRYRSHKTVWALQIAAIDFKDAVVDNPDPACDQETRRTAVITPVELSFAAFTVDADYVRKHQPKAGGYYVVYEDGYKSWSPAEAFEGGYTRI